MLNKNMTQRCIVATIHLSGHVHEANYICPYKVPKIAQHSQLVTQPRWPWQGPGPLKRLLHPIPEIE